MRTKGVVKALAAASVVSLCACGGTRSSTGDSGDSALQGRNMDLLVGYAPGGSYDQWMRLIKPFLEKETGATGVVKNQPGAGGLLAMANASKSRSQTPTLIDVNVPGVVGPILAGGQGVNFDISKFHWIGNLSSEPEVLITAKGGPTSVEALVKKAQSTGKPVKFGAPGPDNFYLDALVLSSLFGMPVDVVTGFDGVSDVYQAVIRGDLDAAVGTLTTAQGVTKSGEAQALATIGPLPQGLSQAEVSALLGDKPVPTVESLLKGEHKLSKARKVILEEHLKVLSLGRPLAAAPATPPETVAALRKAYSGMFASAKFKRAATRQRLYARQISGDKVGATLKELLNPPQAYRALVKQAFSAQS